MEQRFFICEVCGNMVAMVKDMGIPIVCCDQDMTELIPGTTDDPLRSTSPFTRLREISLLSMLICRSSYDSRALHRMDIAEDQIETRENSSNPEKHRRPVCTL